MTMRGIGRSGVNVSVPNVSHASDSFSCKHSFMVVLPEHEVPFMANNVGDWILLRTGEYRAELHGRDDSVVRSSTELGQSSRSKGPAESRGDSETSQRGVTRKHEQ